MTAYRMKKKKKKGLTLAMPFRPNLLIYYSVAGSFLHILMQQDEYKRTSAHLALVRFPLLFLHVERK